MIEFLLILLGVIGTLFITGIIKVGVDSEPNERFIEDLPSDDADKSEQITELVDYMNFSYDFESREYWIEFRMHGQQFSKVCCIPYNPLEPSKSDYYSLLIDSRELKKEYKMPKNVKIKRGDNGHKSPLL